MWKICIFIVIFVGGLGLSPMPAAAGERKVAVVECKPAERKLVYDCMITLKGKKSGKPVAGAEFTVGADMPSMPGAHNVRPTPAAPHGTPGTYRARIHLEMTGEWALKLDFTKPNRDRLIKKLHFGGMKRHGERGSGMSHHGKGEGMKHGGHGMKPNK
ncbi:MAG: FixH family protein [Alphaproteobacteria bacterium]|nr:FixH family protein [Alphaproteobacteria bacterium]